MIFSSVCKETKGRNGIDIHLIGVENSHESLQEYYKATRRLNWYKKSASISSVAFRVMVIVGMHSIRHLYKTKNIQVGWRQSCCSCSKCCEWMCLSIFTSTWDALFFQNALNASVAPRISQVFITKQGLLGYSDFCNENLFLCLSRTL